MAAVSQAAHSTIQAATSQAASTTITLDNSFETPTAAPSALAEAFLDPFATGTQTFIYTFANPAAAGSFISLYSFLEPVDVAAAVMTSQPSVPAQPTSAAVMATTVFTEIAIPLPISNLPASSSTTQLDVLSTIPNSPVIFITSQPHTSFITIHAHANTSTLTPSPSLPSISPPASASSNPSSGLGSSAKTGLSLGAPLGALTLAVLAFSIYRYLKYKQRSRLMHVENAAAPKLPFGLEEAEKGLTAGDQDLRAAGMIDESSVSHTLRETHADGSPVPRELSEAVTASRLRSPEERFKFAIPLELSGMSTVGCSRDAGDWSKTGRQELA